MMSDEMLSQDEIDALLRGTDESLDNNEVQETEPEEILSPIEKDALGEIGNISFGSSATALSTLLNQKVEITTPSVSVIKKDDIADEFPLPYVGIQVKYTEGFTGSNLLVIKQSDAAIIVDLMLGGTGLNPPEVMDEIQLSAVQEAMNQMMGSAATSMSTVFNKRVDISPPTIDILDVSHGQGTEQIPNEELMVKISFRLKVGSLIDSNIMQLLPIDFSKSLVNELMNPSQNADLQPKENHAAASSSERETEKQASGVQAGEKSSQQESQVTYSESISQNQSNQREAEATYQREHQHVGTRLQGSEQPNIQPAVFSSFEPHTLQETETRNLDILLDIPLQVTVELGSTKKSVKDILELSSGSIIELDKLAGEPVDILVNNRLVAQGEVVVIDENFGVRVTDILSQSERIKKLR